MKRQEYKLLVENWNNFLIEEEQNYNLLEKSKNSDEELLYLLEWGDKLEKLIIESGDYLLLESLHESNNYFGQLIEFKDKLKSLFKVRKDVVDDEGNKVTYDDSEESQVKQEYTKLAKTGIAAMAALKFATIIMTALTPNTVAADQAPNFDKLPAGVQEVIKDETGMSSEDLTQIERYDFTDMPMKIGPGTEEIEFEEGIKIGPSKEFKEKIALASAKSVADQPEKVTKETAVELLDRLGAKGGLPDDIQAGAAHGQAVSLGIDTSGPVTVVNSYESSQKADMGFANKIVKAIVAKTKLGKTDVKTRDYTPSREEFGQSFKNFAKLDRPTKVRLLRAAKIKALKDLMAKDSDIFEKAKSWKSTRWGFEGEGGGKDVSDMDHHKAEGDKNARVLSALYGAFSDADFNLAGVKTINDLEKVLDGHNSFTQVTGDNSLADDVKGSIITYVLKNCTDAEIDNLEDNLSKIGSMIDQDLQNLTDPATKFEISGHQDHYTKLK